VKHPGRPEDEGKVFLYQYGQKIYDKLEFKINPPEDDIDPVDVFDFWEGANFRLRVKKVESFPNYDDSSFDQSKPLSEDDEELERIFKSQHSLQAEIAPDKFKSYEELEKRLFEVLGLEKDDAEEKPKAAGPRMKPTAEAKPVAKEEAPWEDDKEEVDAETGEVTEKPALKASSGSAFFKKLKAQA
jgi:hypothetical protein